MEGNTLQSSHFQGGGVKCLACVSPWHFSLLVHGRHQWVITVLSPTELTPLSFWSAHSFFSTSLIYDHRRCSRVIRSSFFLPSSRISGSFYWKMMFRARGLGAGCAGYYWRVIVLVPLRGHGWAMYVPIRIYSKILKNRFTLICVTPVQQHRIHSSVFPFCICNFFLRISMVGQTVSARLMESQIRH